MHTYCALLKLLKLIQSYGDFFVNVDDISSKIIEDYKRSYFNNMASSRILLKLADLLTNYDNK